MKIKELNKISQEYFPLLVQAGNVTKMKKEMRARGFKVKSSSGVAFIHKEKGFVVKLAYLVGEKPKRAVKTVEKPFPYKITRSGEGYKFNAVFMVQPLVDTTEKAWDMNFISKDYNQISSKYYSQMGDDNHEGNLGFYKNKLVAFDW